MRANLATTNLLEAVSLYTVIKELLTETSKSQLHKIPCATFEGIIPLLKSKSTHEDLLVLHCTQYF
jgi:hypothetical protein